MPKRPFDYQFELLVKEMETLQTTIRSYDTILFTIKGWTITVTSAFLFFVFERGGEKFLPAVVVAIALFWAMDIMYKTFQAAFINRYVLIQRYLQDHFQQDAEAGTISITVPDLRVRYSLLKNDEQPTSVQEAVTSWHTSLLYICLIALIAIMAILV